MELARKIEQSPKHTLFPVPEEIDEQAAELLNRAIPMWFDPESFFPANDVSPHIFEGISWVIWKLESVLEVLHANIDDSKKSCTHLWVVAEALEHQIAHTKICSGGVS